MEQSKTKVYKCVCGVEAIGPDTCSVGDIMKATGFKALMDCANGLGILYICPKCIELAKPHTEALFEIFGKHYSIYWGSILSLAGIKKEVKYP